MGVDVKSHQDGPPCPSAVIVQGNVVQDAACDAARSLRLPSGVAMPSGGFFAGLSIRGRSVTRSALRAVRSEVREQALALWKTKPVQGKVALMHRALFLPCLDVAAFTCCRVPPRWRHLLLPGDLPSAVDLSKVMFRSLRAIGGGWTELLHSDSSLAQLAGAWAVRRGLPSSRVCPLCRSAVGTPRHVIMSCAAVSSRADAVRDAVEAELARHSPAASLCEQAEAWWQRECECGRGGLRAPCCPGADVRWPILHAWRWLLPMPVREAAIGSDVGGHSAHGTGLEGAADLAYRCAMPRALGLALCRGPGPPLAAEGPGSDSDGGEEFATLAEPEAAAAEASRRSAAIARYRPAVEVTTVLALGVHSLRGAYAELVGRWRQLAAEEEFSLQRLPVVEAPVGLPPALPARAPVRPRFLVLRSLLAQWAATPSGSRSVFLLRWQVPTEAALVARIRRELPPSGASDGQILSEVEPLVIPARDPDGLR